MVRVYEEDSSVQQIAQMAAVEDYRKQSNLRHTLNEAGIEIKRTKRKLHIPFDPWNGPHLYGIKISIFSRSLCGRDDADKILCGSLSKSILVGLCLQMLRTSFVRR